MACKLKMQKGIFLKFWVKRYSEHVFHLLSSQACKWVLPHPSGQCACQSHRGVDVPLAARRFSSCSTWGNGSSTNKEKGAACFCSYSNLPFPNHSVHISHTPTPDQDNEPCVMLFLQTGRPLPTIPHWLHPRQSFLSRNFIISLHLS